MDNSGPGSSPTRNDRSAQTRPDTSPSTRNDRSPPRPGDKSAPPRNDRSPPRYKPMVPELTDSFSNEKGYQRWYMRVKLKLESEGFEPMNVMDFKYAGAVPNATQREREAFAGFIIYDALPPRMQDLMCDPRNKDQIYYKKPIELWRWIQFKAFVKERY